jgi:uncharacterized OB-fold protein
VSGESPASGLGPPAPDKYLRREMDAATAEFYRRLSQGELSTTRCDGCRRATFPPHDRCPVCGQAQSWFELPRRGRLHAFTTQETALRFRAPSVLALVELGEVVVPGIAEAPYPELRIGQEVRVELRPEPDTGLTLLAFVVERPAPPGTHDAGPGRGDGPA